MTEQEEDKEVTPAVSGAPIQQFWNKAVRNIFIVGIIIVVVWEILVWLIPEGWGMAVVNILGFLASILVFWYSLFNFFKATMPIWLAWLVSALCWALLFLGLRSLVASLLLG